jgi:hypothetical protein
MTWFELKEAIGLYTGLERDALHVHAALFLYILAMALFRRSPRSRIPWLIVLAILGANEIYDLVHNWPDGPEWAIGASAKDLWNTMLWPTVLLFVGRYTSWFQRPRGPAAANPDPGPV